MTTKIYSFKAVSHYVSNIFTYKTDLFFDYLLRISSIKFKHKLQYSSQFKNCAERPQTGVWTGVTYGLTYLPISLYNEWLLNGYMLLFSKNIQTVLFILWFQFIRSTLASANILYIYAKTNLKSISGKYCCI